MRYAILADVHGNFAAFSAMVAALERRGVDRWVNLGDLVGYGPEPVACIELSRELGALQLLGNHDYALLFPESETAQTMRLEARLTIDWSREQLTAAGRDYLAALPRLAVEGDFTFAHAGFDDSDEDYWPYVLDRKSALFQLYLQETAFGCIGHGHIPLAFAKSAAGLAMTMLHQVAPERGGGNAFLWSPGSVGQSRDGDWRAAALWFDTVAGCGEIVRSEYDVERTRAAIQRLGWPESLAERLAPGPGSVQ